MATTRLTLDHTAVSVADFDPKRAENDDRILPLQRPGLPFPDFVQHGASHTADQVWRYLQAIHILEVSADVTNLQSVWYIVFRRK